MSHDTPDLSGWTPLKVDTALAEIYIRIYKARARVRAMKTTASNRRYMTEAEIARAAKALADAEVAIQALLAEARPYEDEFVRRGRWTRTFLVTSSNVGHVHSSQGCSTCRLTTEFIWLPEYSGVPEANIVQDAGERACTTCYPSAPTEVRVRATKIFSPQEKAAVQARADRDAARIQREVKKAVAAIANPDGSPLEVDGWGVVRTERTAQTLYVERRADQLAGEKGLDPSGYGRLYVGTIPALLEALAHKRGQTVEETAAALEPKAEARVRREWT